MHTAVLTNRRLTRALIPAAMLLAVTVQARPAFATDDDSWWGRDKALHFLVSASIAGGTYAIGTAAWDSRVPTACLAFGVTLAAGASNEVWDATGNGDASWKDFAWDVLGAIAGVGLSYAIDTAVRPAPALR